MKIKCFNGPHDGKEFTVSHYLSVWQLPYPFSGIPEYETIEYYRQHYQHMYEWVGSAPYYPLKNKLGKK